MKTLHLVCGKPAVGKTTFARSLAKRHGAVLLDSDVATEAVVKAGLSLAGMDPDDRDSKGYKQAFREPVYASLFATAKHNLAHLDVVIAGPFSAELGQPDWPESLARRFACQVRVYWVTCAESERIARLKMRGNPCDVAKLADLQAHQDYYLLQAPEFDHERIDTTQ